MPVSNAAVLLLLCFHVSVCSRFCTITLDGADLSLGWHSELAQFGPQTLDPLNSMISFSHDGCSDITEVVEGTIVVLNRGGCSFLHKARNAMTAGAVALVIANYEFDDHMSMTPAGSNDITIPVLSVGHDVLQKMMSLPRPVLVTISQPGALPFESHLPIVVVDTHGRKFVDFNKISAQISFMDTAQANNSLTAPPSLTATASIGHRGRASYYKSPKKSFAFEFQNELGAGVDQAPLGLPLEEDWILYASYADKTFARNYFAYNVSNELGMYASRTRFVELFIVKDGQIPSYPEHYQGVYVLLEKMKRDKHRIAVKKQKTDPSGGYVLKNDWPDPDETVIRLNQSGTELVFVYPKATSLQPYQRSFIETFFHDFEEALAGPDFDTPHGYESFINTSSFVDYMLMSELTLNQDGYHRSSYMNKDVGAKLNMGPIWDLDLGYGNSFVIRDIWIFADIHYWFSDTIAPMRWWFIRLMQDPAYVHHVQRRWLQMRQTVLSDDHIAAVINSVPHTLRDAADRNFARWPILNVSVWPYPHPPNDLVLTYPDEVAQLLDHICYRSHFMDRGLLATSVPHTLDCQYCNYCYGDPPLLDHVLPMDTPAPTHAPTRAPTPTPTVPAPPSPPGGGQQPSPGPPSSSHSLSPSAAADESSSLSALVPGALGAGAAFIVVVALLLLYARWRGVWGMKPLFRRLPSSTSSNPDELTGPVGPSSTV